MKEGQAEGGLAFSDAKCFVCPGRVQDQSSRIFNHIDLPRVMRRHGLI